MKKHYVTTSTGIQIGCRYQAPRESMTRDEQLVQDAVLGIPNYTFGVRENKFIEIVSRLVFIFALIVVAIKLLMVNL